MKRPKPQRYRLYKHPDAAGVQYLRIRGPMHRHFVLLTTSPLVFSGVALFLIVTYPYSSAQNMLDAALIFLGGYGAIAIVAAFIMWRGNRTSVALLEFDYNTSMCTVLGSVDKKLTRQSCEFKEVRFLVAPLGSMDTGNWIIKHRGPNASGWICVGEAAFGLVRSEDIDETVHELRLLGAQLGIEIPIHHNAPAVGVSQSR